MLNQLLNGIGGIPFINSRLKPLAARLMQSVSSTDIKEIIPLEPRKSSFSNRRINLLLPSIRREHRFGGISTALSLFNALADDQRLDRRIILTDAAPGVFARDGFVDYRLVASHEESLPGWEMVSLNDRRRKSLAVGPSDYFISTTWWTAFHARKLVHWQHRTYGQPLHKRIYFIQDFEPGFYPWSGKYALAEGTYRGDTPQIGIFNSSLLYDYFKSHGYQFHAEFVFEPVLNERLKTELDRWLGNPKPKQKQILVYGRPGVERNAFPLIVASLKKWVRRQPHVHQWTLLSVGEKHSDIKLGNKMILKSAGKLSLEGYARELEKSALGLSFMVSPHPSYPPMEMAVFGMGVITNRYENKDLSRLHSNITTIDFSDESIVAALLDQCSCFERDHTCFRAGKLLQPDYLGSDDPFPFVTAARKALFS